MAIIIGIIWLLPISRNDADTRDAVAALEREAHDVVRLNGIVLTMAYGVSLAVTVLLASTMYNYFYVVRSGHVPATWVDWTLASPAVVVALAAIIGLMRRVTRTDRAKDLISVRTLGFSAHGVLVYAIAGTVFSGLIGNLGNTWWHPVPRIIIGASIVMGLVIPCLLFIGLIHAMPRLPTRARNFTATPSKVRGRSNKPKEPVADE